MSKDQSPPPPPHSHLRPRDWDVPFFSGFVASSKDINNSSSTLHSRTRYIRLAACDLAYLIIPSLTLGLYQCRASCLVCPIIYQHNLTPNSTRFTGDVPIPSSRPSSTLAPSSTTSTSLIHDIIHPARIECECEW